MRYLAQAAMGAALTLGVPMSGHAGSIPSGFTSLLVFGDSLSDTGNVSELVSNATGGLVTFPDAPYNPGRFTGGDNYVDVLQDMWNLTPNVDLFNYAFGGAKAVTDAGDVFVDFAEQAFLFGLEGPSLGSDPLTIVNFGGNDVINAAWAAGGVLEFGVSGVAGDESTPGQIAAGLATASSIGAAAADAIRDGIQFLSLTGLDDFMLFNLPDVGAVPRFNDPNTQGINPDSGNSTAPYATTATDAFNEQLGLNADLLRGLGLNIYEIDVAGRFADILSDPAGFGLSDGTSSCGNFVTTVPAGPLTLPVYDFSDATCDETDIGSITAPYWDDVHPNQNLHEEYAALVNAALVPVPASLVLLGGGLLILGGLRRVCHGRSARA